MSESKKLDTLVNNIIINSGEKIQINQTFIFKTKITEDDIQVVSIEDIEEKVKHLEILASVVNILATISLIILPLISDFLV